MRSSRPLRKRFGPLAVVLPFLLAVPLAAQQGTVSGTITDAAFERGIELLSRRDGSDL